MLTKHTVRDEQALDTGWRDGDLPPLTTVDRLALRLGLRLILWGQQHARAVERAAERQQHRTDAAERARDEAFQRRAYFGHIW